MDLAWEAHGTGRPLLCLHGFGMDRTVMAAALEPVLAQRPGWRRIYPDLPGHGESPAGPGDSDGVAASVHEWADFLLGGAPAVLAGWSYGGYLATALAARWPASVAGLLLVCTGVRIRPEDRELPPGPPPPAEPGWLDQVPPELCGHLDAALGHRTAAVAGRVAAALAAARPGDGAYQERLRGTGFPVADEDRLGYPGPACLLAGREDRIGGYAGPFRTLAAFPAASYTVLAGAGHYLPLEQPAAFRALTLAWLDTAFGDGPGSGPISGCRPEAGYGTFRPVNEYLETNRASWDERAPAHAASPGYHVAEFLADPGYLSEVVTFDLPRLGDIAGLRGVHLQCHIGTDTVSLTRLGASMTGLDFSAPALAEARTLAEQTGADAKFVEGELSQATRILGKEAYDLVFTGVGALCWLPSIRVWAGEVAGLLRPGGRLFLREGHPMLWTLQEGRDDDLLVVKDTYFERPEPTTWDEGGTYVPTDVEFTTTVTHDWNHGLGEIVSALLDNGMVITGLEEHDSVPWEALPGQMTEIGGGEWQLTQKPWRVPHTYTLQAVKR